MISAGLRLGNRYRLDRRIAAGGMGEVWVGTDEVLGRTVAIKIIRPELAEEPGFANRFRNEAKHAARISHGNIAQVHDYGADEGLDYLVMEYVDGDSLADRIDRGPMSATQAYEILKQAARALDAAHAAGLVHRDVKPANILLTPDGDVKLTDFGIARANGESKLTRTGEVMGTAQYLAPEAALGRDATGAADLYALAVVAYEMLAGRRPFEADSQVGVAMMHVHNAPPPLPESTPVGVASAVMHALAKDPAARPGSCRAFAEEFGRGLNSPPAARAGQPLAGQYGAHPSPTPLVAPASGPGNSPYALQPPRGYTNDMGPSGRAGGPMHGLPVGAPSAYATPYRSSEVGDGTRARRIGFVWLASCVVVFISLFLPWAAVGDHGFTAWHLAEAERTYNPSADASEYFGGFMTFSAIVLAGLSIPNLVRRPHWGWCIPAFLMSGFGALIWFAAIAAVTSTSDGPKSDLSTQPGLWVCLAAGLVIPACVVASLIVKRS